MGARALACCLLVWAKVCPTTTELATQTLHAWGRTSAPRWASNSAAPQPRLAEQPAAATEQYCLLTTAHPPHPPTHPHTHHTTTTTMPLQVRSPHLAGRAGRPLRQEGARGAGPPQPSLPSSLLVHKLRTIPALPKPVRSAACRRFAAVAAQNLAFAPGPLAAPLPDPSLPPPCPHPPPAPSPPAGGHHVGHL